MAGTAPPHVYMTRILWPLDGRRCSRGPPDLATFPRRLKHAAPWAGILICGGKTMGDHALQFSCRNGCSLNACINVGKSQVTLTALKCASCKVVRHRTARHSRSYCGHETFPSCFVQYD